MAGSVARAVGGACSTTALTLPVVRTALPQCAQPAWPASCLASTPAALQELRALLQSSLRSAEAAEVFAQLFASWTHSCAASLALALLAQAHSLACELLAVMASEPLSMRPETTVELSQLVSLLEAPAFAALRLQLLQPAQHPALLRAVHGLLMLLPQVRAWFPAWWLVNCGVCVHRQAGMHPGSTGKRSAASGRRVIACPAWLHVRLSCLQGDAFRMLQTRLQSIPLMALLSMKEQQQRVPGSTAGPQQQAGSPTQLTPASGGGSNSSSGASSSAGLDATAAAAAEQPLSPSFKQQQLVQQRAPLIEERRLVQLFKSRASGLG